ncbi:ABC transporter substrate-binding protein [Epibacterium ulvae]|uniref:ABC transporter substrate-binding protein n=1 Tax=Epibacterium ulvae TaxID=1156985 RepID=UPI001BFBFA2F|nr:ABC transporter substrate-binding protein [Epibacterium ulvae]MBT8152658.1 ABC transporter substrate-binding protein [Epibacterium ulvae]
MFAKFVTFAVIGVFAWMVPPAKAAEEGVEFYIAADFLISAAAAQSIELGVQTALDEVGNALAGEPVRLIRMDHRSNVKRAGRTYQTYVKSDRALAIIGGKQSPPYLAHKEYINSNGVLKLLPWSAAGPVTRGNDGLENWVFRLSVDDAQSGKFFVEQAIEKDGCARVAFFLLNTGWVRANQKSLTAALAERGMKSTATEFFSSSIGEATAVSLAARTKRSQADCAVMLSNWVDGALILNTLHRADLDIRIYSHWGIIGRAFTEHVSDESRRALHLKVLQTCALRQERAGNPILEQALHRVSPEKAALKDLRAATGFVHGYDLTRVLVAAIEQAAPDDDWKSADITQKRALVRNALERIEQPVAGILNTYDPPFHPFEPGAVNAYEALGQQDLCFAQFSSEGQLEDAG